MRAILICLLLTSCSSASAEDKVSTCNLEISGEISSLTTTSVKNFLTKNITRITEKLPKPLDQYTKLDIPVMMSINGEKKILVVLDFKYYSARIATGFVILEKSKDDWVISTLSIKDQGVMKFIWRYTSGN